MKFLGFSFYHKKGELGIRVHPKPAKKFKQKLKEETGGSSAMSMEEAIHPVEPPYTERYVRCVRGRLLK